MTGTVDAEKMATRGGVVPGGKLPQNRLGNGGGLRQRHLHVRSRLEVDFDDRNAVKRLRFDVLDVVYKCGDGALGVAGDTLFHLLRLKSRVVPHQSDYRNVDFRENVRRSARENYRRQQDDDESEHHKGVRSRER